MNTRSQTRHYTTLLKTKPKAPKISHSAKASVRSHSVKRSRPSYPPEEMTLLSSLLDEMKPVHCYDYQKLADAYNSRRPKGSPVRSSDALRQKLRDVRKRKSATTTVASVAVDASSAILTLNSTSSAAGLNERKVNPQLPTPLAGSAMDVVMDSEDESSYDTVSLPPMTDPIRDSTAAPAAHPTAISPPSSPDSPTADGLPAPSTVSDTPEQLEQQKGLEISARVEPDVRHSAQLPTTVSFSSLLSERTINSNFEPFSTESAEDQVALMIDSAKSMESPVTSQPTDSAVSSSGQIGPLEVHTTETTIHNAEITAAISLLNQRVSALEERESKWDHKLSTINQALTEVQQAKQIIKDVIRGEWNDKKTDIAVAVGKLDKAAGLALEQMATMKALRASWKANM
ncbi:hypothetical protein HDV05_000443 [Chytridiales sp. JEL 0842]|nr:hypothetical protein HDV05_000443 [Chytridiales sp. JEL 0842]